MTTARPSSARNRWVLVVVWAVCILVASTVRVKGPNVAIPGIGLDKIVHFAIYALLAALLYRALRRTESWRSKAAWYAFLAAGAYGFVMESVQWAFFPQRSFEVWDIVANISGSIAALLALRNRME